MFGFLAFFLPPLLPSRGEVSLGLESGDVEHVEHPEHERRMPRYALVRLSPSFALYSRRGNCSAKSWKKTLWVSGVILLIVQNALYASNSSCLATHCSAS